MHDPLWDFKFRAPKWGYPVQQTCETETCSWAAQAHEMKPDHEVDVDDEWYVVRCALALLGALAAIYIHQQTVDGLYDNTGPSSRRGLYYRIVVFPVIYGVSHALAVVLPEMIEYASLLSHIFLASTMNTFIDLLLLLTYRSATKGPAPAVLFFDKHAYALESVHGVLMDQPPLKYWAVPPLGCIFLLPGCGWTPCGKEALPSLDLLVSLRAMLRLFAIVAPLETVSRTAIERDLVNIGTFAFYEHVALLILQLVIALFASYSLFVMFMITHVPLRDQRTAWKFASIKVIVAMDQIQRPLLEVLAGPENMSWLTVIQALEAPLVCVLMQHAFRPEELKDGEPRTMAQTMAESGHPLVKFTKTSTTGDSSNFSAAKGDSFTSATRSFVKGDHSFIGSEPGSDQSDMESALLPRGTRSHRDSSFSSEHSGHSESLLKELQATRAPSARLPKASTQPRAGRRGSEMYSKSFFSALREANTPRGATGARLHEQP